VTDAEGVIKYRLDFTPGPPPDKILVRNINAWRHVLHLLGLIGQDDGRYAGLGFGNVSCRLAPGKNEFIISGTQTAHLSKLNAEQYVLVTECNINNNHIVASGRVKPSSEALTHGLLYQTSPVVNVVFHVHCPQIWNHARELSIPSTANEATYGTPQMALEISRLMLQRATVESGIIIMGGHLDGVIAFGQTADEAGNTLVDTFAQALRY